MGGFTIRNPPPEPLMPKLRTLHITADPFFTAVLVCEFKAPPSTLLKICCRDADVEMTFDPDYKGCKDFTPLLSWVSGYIDRIENARAPFRVLHIRSSYLTQYDNDTVTLRFYSSPHPFDAPSSLSHVPEPHVEMSLSNTSPGDRCSPPDYFQKSFYRIAPYLPLSKIEYLFLDRIPSMEKPHDTFGVMTGVHTLHISGEHTSALLDVLTFEDSGDHDDKASLQLPLLSRVLTVTLHDTPLRESKHALEFIRDRAKRGCAIQTLRLSDCRDGSLGVLEKLRRKVPLVEWDGEGEVVLF